MALFVSWEAGLCTEDGVGHTLMCSLSAVFAYYFQCHVSPGFLTNNTQVPSPWLCWCANDNVSGGFGKHRPRLTNERWRHLCVTAQAILFVGWFAFLVYFNINITQQAPPHEWKSRKKTNGKWSEVSDKRIVRLRITNTRQQIFTNKLLLFV